MFRASFAVLAAVLCCMALCTVACTQTCESSCDDQLDDCLDRAPPGASRQDCFTQHSECLSACSQAT